VNAGVAESHSASAHLRGVWSCQATSWADSLVGQTSFISLWEYPSWKRPSSPTRAVQTSKWKQ